jgi:hypothetical protein
MEAQHLTQIKHLKTRLINEQQVTSVMYTSEEHRKISRS